MPQLYGNTFRTPNSKRKLRQAIRFTRRRAANLKLSPKESYQRRLSDDIKKRPGK